MIKVDKQKWLGDQFVTYHRRQRGLPAERFLRLLAGECVDKFFPEMSKSIDVPPPKPKFPKPEEKKRGKGK